MTKRIDIFRFGKSYSIGETAKLARTAPVNVRRWLQGHEAKDFSMRPVFGDPRAESGQVSFLELAEIIVVAGFRAERRVTLQRLRRAHAFAKRAWPGLAYPFASLNLLEFGGEVLHEFDQSEPGKSLSLSLEGQWVLPGLVWNVLKTFDFGKDRMAVAWFPAGKDVPIVVDPHHAGGRPTVTGTGVTVATISRRFFDGDQSIDFIASDLEIPESAIEEVIRFARAA